MSVAVPLDELLDQLEGYGSCAYLVTVAANASPHTASVRLGWDEGALVGGCGRRTAANIAANDTVALLWPATEPGAYALIVDGWAEVQELEGSAAGVRIRPFKAVLHVTSGPPCT